MSLRSKVLLGVGILLFLMVIIMYILPAYFVKRDVYKAAEEIHELIIQEQNQLLESQKTWTSLAFEKSKENLNSILYTLYEMKEMSSQLIITNDNPIAKVWERMINIASLDPDIGFIQMHSLKENQTAVLIPASTNLYPVKSEINEKDFSLFLLQGLEREGDHFMGIRLPTEFQVDPGYHYYILAGVKGLNKELQELHEEISEALKEFSQNQRKGQLSEVQKLRGFPTTIYSDKIGFYWALKMHMIRLLAPFYVNGIQFKGIPEITPQGIVRVDSQGNGLGILSDEIFMTQPLFNDKLFYETHPSKLGANLSDATAVIVDKVRRQSFIAQTALLDSTFLSLGTDLRNLAKELALASNKTILMQVSETLWIGFNGIGLELPPHEIAQLVKGLNRDSGIVSIKGQDYFFSLFSSLNGDQIRLYQLYQMGGEKSILGTLVDLENNLSRRISLQLALISLGTMVLVLLFIGRIGLNVIYPITKLAKATEDVVHGRYEDVTLPEMGNRQDEVATLTRSFGDMVKGLQEREKIRGVLDKVVSKEVADEILRTQIHLGGEDRIVTMLFSDIRDFSNLTENLSPQQTIHILNGCMTKISRVIEGEGGVIDKYVGDEVMAIFGAPTTHPDHALRAVSSGMLIVETLKRWNMQRVQANLPAIEMGIGIHTGLVVAGNMGAEDRLNYTVLGANVNLAARLCDVAKRNQLIISEKTLKEPNIEESFYVKTLTPISLKGFSEPVQIYEVLGFKWEET